MTKAKIYTRTGDGGSTSLIGGKRVSKSSARLEAYGSLDELNSVLGLMITYLRLPEDVDFMEDIQRNLFRIGGLLATEPPVGEPPATFDKAVVEKLEKEIDQMEHVLPPLKAFILPRGGKAACLAHVSRTICRRAERHIVKLSEEAPVDAVLLCYVNRLSDYLFVLARKLNFLEDFEEKNV